MKRRPKVVLAKFDHPEWYSDETKNIKLWLPSVNKIIPSTLTEEHENILDNSWFKVTKLQSRNMNMIPKVVSEEIEPVEPKQSKRKMPYVKKEQKLPLCVKIIEIFPSKDGIPILKKAFDAARSIWNECVEYINTNKQTGNLLKEMRTYLVNKWNQTKN